MVTTPPTLIFDLSEVLISGIIGIERTIAPQLGLDERTVILGFSGEPLITYSLGRITEDQYLDWVCKRSGWVLDHAEVKQVIRQNFLHTMPGMPDLIMRLAARYDLVLFSDHSRDWITYIEQAHPFMHAFRQRLYSYDLGLLKRCDGAFESALALIERQPEECIFIDDHQNNVDAAIKAGLRGIRFTDRDSLTAALYPWDITTD